MGIFNPASLHIGDQKWILPAILLAIAGMALTVWLSRRRLQARLQLPGLLMRVTAWLLLCVCLMNPLWSSSRPRSGANVVAVVADVSRSHLITSNSDSATRADELKTVLEQGERTESAGWLTRLSQDFELRRYTVADRLLQVRDYSDTSFDGAASSLGTALRSLQQRYQGQPLAGIVLLSDGNSTDALPDDTTLRQLPPVHVVVPSENLTLPDVSVGEVSSSQSAFDDAPLTILVNPETTAVSTGKIAITLEDATGVPLETITRDVSDKTPVRFTHRPTDGGTVFYRIRTQLLSDTDGSVVEEATDVNNSRLISIDRGSEPRRILYVSGRPNWDFKFLRRAVQTDSQLDLVALIRIARKEARFDFRGREGESANSLFRGFDRADPDTVEEYDEAVMVRLNTKDSDELVGGFPESAEELFRYDALVVDDVEAEFFTADQHALIHDFVSRRGGGFLMLGGQESFRQGNFDRTQIGELLPIDLSRPAEFPESPLRISLTRDGWLQPWIRLRDDELQEEQRLEDMPDFLTLNPAGYVRPGAVVMAHVSDSTGTQWPALVTQRFGRGRTGALCVGDFWRWRLRQGLQEYEKAMQSPLPLGTTVPSNAEPATDDLSDHARASRQMFRWLVADVPRRLNITVREETENGSGAMLLTAEVLDPVFQPSDNAEVTFFVTSPDGTQRELQGTPSDSYAGIWETPLTALTTGEWTVEVRATTGDGDASEVLTAASGWASQPDQKEMQRVSVNRAALEELTSRTGGRIWSADEVEDLARLMPGESVPLTEIWSWPIWNTWAVFMIAVVLLSADWTLRRRGGLP